MIDISTNDRFTMHIDSIRLIIITINRYPAVTAVNLYKAVKC